MGNIISFATVEEAGFKIAHDSPSNSFIASGPTQTLIFPNHHLDSMGTKVPTTGMCLLDTVTNNSKGYSPCQVVEAKAARNTMNMMRLPSFDTFFHMVRDNLINNCPVHLDSIKIADNDFGLDIASLQGKMT